MSIEPHNVRVAFGTAIPVHIPEPEPSPHIIPIFRNVGQSNAGLTPAIEDALRVAMANARPKGHIAALPQSVYAAQEAGAQGGAAPKAPTSKMMLRVLFHLRIADENQADLIKAMGSSGGNICRHIIQAQSFGWIQRHPLKNGWHLSLTSAGRRALQEVRT